MWAFKEKIEKKYNVQLQHYHHLWQWSIDHIPEFWEETWHFTGILSSKDRESKGLPPFDQVHRIFIMPRDIQLLPST